MSEVNVLLWAKYGVRYVPVVEIGQNGVYTGVTELGIEAFEKVLVHYGVR